MKTNKQLAEIRKRVDSHAVWDANGNSIFDDADDLLAEIARLRAEREWVSVEDTSPAVEGQYLTYGTWPDGRSWYTVFNWTGGKWMVGALDIDVSLYVTYYMPMPPSPEAK